MFVHRLQLTFFSAASCEIVIPKLKVSQDDESSLKTVPANE
jgi:hypothetical protein